VLNSFWGDVAANLQTPSRATCAEIITPLTREELEALIPYGRTPKRQRHNYDFRVRAIPFSMSLSQEYMFCEQCAQPRRLCLFHLNPEDLFRTETDRQYCSEGIGEDELELKWCIRGHHELLLEGFLSDGMFMAMCNGCREKQQ
jgi:hypothetical protein